jgi:4,5-dihydroxyphthalate decarboxylase
MPKKLSLTLACGDYDIVRPLLNEKVEVDGVDLTILTDMDSATTSLAFSEQRRIRRGGSVQLFLSRCAR